MTSITLLLPESFHRSEWRLALAETLVQHRGKTLHLSQIYLSMSTHPLVKRRFEENEKSSKAKVRQQLQYLRDSGLLEWESKGYWHVPSGFLAA